MWVLVPALKQIIEKKLKDLVAQVMVLGTSVSSAISNVFAPTPQCPEAVKTALQKRIEEKRKARKDAALAKKLEIKEKRKSALKKKIDERAAFDKAYKNSTQYQADLKEVDKKAEILA